MMETLLRANPLSELSFMDDDIDVSQDMMEIKRRLKKRIEQVEVIERPSDDQLIAFTLNPDPKKYKSYEPQEQYLSLLKCVFLNKQIKSTFDYFYFTPELTDNGNIVDLGIDFVK